MSIIVIPMTLILYDAIIFVSLSYSFLHNILVQAGSEYIANLAVCNDFLLFNERIVMPIALKTETLQQVYSKGWKDAWLELLYQFGGLGC